MKTIHLGPAMGFRLLDKRYRPVDPLEEFAETTTFDWEKTPTEGMLKLKGKGGPYYLVDTGKLKSVHSIATPSLPPLTIWLFLGYILLLTFTALQAYLVYYIYFPFQFESIATLVTLPPLPVYPSTLYSTILTDCVLFALVLLGWRTLHNLFINKKYTIWKIFIKFLCVANILVAILIAGYSWEFVTGTIPLFLLDTQLPLLSKLAKSNLAVEQAGFIGLSTGAVALICLLIYRRISRKIGRFQVNHSKGKNSHLFHLAIDMGFLNAAYSYCDQEGKEKKVVTLRKKIWFVTERNQKLAINIVKTSEESTIKSAIKIVDDPCVETESLLFETIYSPDQEKEIFLHKHQLFEEAKEYPESHKMIQAHLQMATQRIYHSQLKKKAEEKEKGIDLYFSSIAFTHPVVEQSEHFENRAAKCLKNLDHVQLEFYPEPLAALEGFRREIKSKDKDRVFRETTLLIDIGDGTTDLTLAQGNTFYSLSLPVGARRCVSASLRGLEGPQNLLERGELSWQKKSGLDNENSPIGNATWRQAFKTDRTERRDLPGFAENLSLVAAIAKKTNPGLILFSGLGATNNSLKAAILEKISENVISISPIVLLAEHLKFSGEGEDQPICPFPMKGVTSLGALNKMISDEEINRSTSPTGSHLSPIEEMDMLKTIKQLFLLDGENDWTILGCNGFPLYIHYGEGKREKLTATKFYDPLTYYSEDEIPKFSFLKELTFDQPPS